MRRGGTCELIMDAGTRSRRVFTVSLMLLNKSVGASENLCTEITCKVGVEINSLTTTQPTLLLSTITLTKKALVN